MKRVEELKMWADGWRCFASWQVCQWQPFQARWCLRRASPCRWRLLLSTLCCWCPTWIQRSGVGGHVTGILTNQGPPSQLTVVINILVPPQSVSPHCLFILFGEKRLNISEAADNKQTCLDSWPLTLAVPSLHCPVNALSGGSSSGNKHRRQCGVEFRRVLTLCVAIHSYFVDSFFRSLIFLRVHIQ